MTIFMGLGGYYWEASTCRSSSYFLKYKDLVCGGQTESDSLIQS